MIWTHGEDSLLKFINYLNSLHPSIIFTHEFSHSSISFLDTTVKFNQERELITTLYNKPTDTHLYLHYTSAHQDSILTKGPYSQYFRLKRICSLDEDFKSNAYQLGTTSNEGTPSAHWRNTSREPVYLLKINYLRSNPNLNPPGQFWLPILVLGTQMCLNWLGTIGALSKTWKN